MPHNHQGSWEPPPTKTALGNVTPTKLKLAELCLLKATITDSGSVKFPLFGKLSCRLHGEPRVTTQYFDFESGDVWIFSHGVTFKKTVEIVRENDCEV